MDAPPEPPAPPAPLPPSVPDAGGLRLKYQSLRSDQITATARTLEQRIRERFPRANLARIATELIGTTDAVARMAVWLSRPILGLRLLVSAAALGLVALFLATLAVARSQVELFSSISDYLQGLDAAINEVVFLGIALYFLVTLETRLKRRRAFRSLHVLRSMAHIIDMHQLTKDPDRVLHPGGDTPSSPARTMTRHELTRYLDYCTEMLALLSKLAALHVQQFPDPVTLSAVNDIENLTSDLSRKIWQKIMILDRFATPPA